jgi:outer membrane protein OmpA-like peptidoglycan-associated protein
MHRPGIDELERFQSKMLAHARALLIEAELAYENENLERAELLAILTQQRIRIGQQLLERDATRALLEASLEAKLPAPSLRQSTTSATPSSVTADAHHFDVLDAEAASPAEWHQRARERVFEEQLARTEVLGQLADERCPGVFREYSALVDLAQEQLDKGDSISAFELALRASERWRRCGAEPISSSSTAAGKAKAPDSSSDLASLRTREQPGSDSDTDAALAKERLSRLQIMLARHDSSVPGNEQWLKVETLTQSAQKRLDEGELAMSAKLAAEALQSADKLEAAAFPVAGGDCGQSRVRLDLASQNRDRVLSANPTGSQRARFDRASERLVLAELAQDNAQCERSAMLADDAIALFQDLDAAQKLAAIEPDANIPVVEPSASTRPSTPAEPSTISIRESTSASKGDSAAARERAAELIDGARKNRMSYSGAESAPVFLTGSGLLKQAVSEYEAGAYDAAGSLAQQASYAFVSAQAAASGGNTENNEAWIRPYGVVVDALALRERALASAQESEAAELNAAESLIENARLAWHQQQYDASERFALEASASYQRVIDAAEGRLDADARQALEAQRLAAEQALLLDQEEQQRWEAEQEQLRSQAQDRLREAQVQEEKCRREQCEKRALELWLQAEALLSDAQAEFDATRFERADALAVEALSALRELSELEQPGFVVPDGLTRVRLDGRQLVLNPKIRFSSGTNDLESESLKSLDELAQTLLSNAEYLLEVQIVGHTDSSGSAKQNRKLSLQRAQKVQTELIARGVDATLLRVEGRGPDAPLVSNDTADGRELNRRVELFIQTR